MRYIEVMSKFIDVSHEIEHEMITYKGLPGPVITEHLSREASRKIYAPGTEFQIARIEMVANTGTYLDSPFHRYAEGSDLSLLSLSSLANLDAIVVRIAATHQPSIGPSHFDGLEFQGKAVLIHTGWDIHWRTEQYSQEHPHLTSAAAQFLANGKPALVGIDSFNIDSTSDPSRPAHSILLKAGIPIVEHLCNLQSLPDREFRFFAIPPKVKRMGTFPVRAFGLLNE